MREEYELRIRRLTEHVTELQTRLHTWGADPPPSVDFLMSHALATSATCAVLPSLVQQGPNGVLGPQGPQSPKGIFAPQGPNGAQSTQPGAVFKRIVELESQVTQLRTQLLRVCLFSLPSSDPNISHSPLSLSQSTLHALCFY